MYKPPMRLTGITTRQRSFLYLHIIHIQRFERRVTKISREEDESKISAACTHESLLALCQACCECTLPTVDLNLYSWVHKADRIVYNWRTNMIESWSLLGWSWFSAFSSPTRGCPLVAFARLVHAGAATQASVERHFSQFNNICRGVWVTVGHINLQRFYK